VPSFGDVGFFSDDFGEFVERFDQAEVWRGFGSEFVVSAADVLDESMAFDNDRGSSVAFESAHRPEPCQVPSRAFNLPWSHSTRNDILSNVFQKENP
jgi:hypothetical protein